MRYLVIMRNLAIMLFVIIILGSCQLTPDPAKDFPFENSQRINCPGRKPQVIAIIDTGFGVDGDEWKGQETTRLCQYGHKDFTNGIVSDDFNTRDSVPMDDHGHGTHIAGLVDQYARQVSDDFCIVILKYYDGDATGTQNLEREVAAIEYARQIKADYINFSGGGVFPDSSEREAVRKYIEEGGIFVAAAGNESDNLDFFHYYPAQYVGVIVVGAHNKSRTPLNISNFGKRVNRWELGKNVLMYNHYMTGTSQATAIATGKLVAEKNKTCK